MILQHLSPTKHEFAVMLTPEINENTQNFEAKKIVWRNDNHNKVKDLNTRNRSVSHGRSDWQSRGPVINDDGYFSLAAIGGKNNENFLLPPTNSWPLRRKIGAKELQEYGEKLDSGSDIYIESKSKASSNSVNSNSPAAAFIDFETQGTSPGNDKCRTARNCIDYCTCMLCVKSAYYICYDGEDDTGTETYDPCFCSNPSWSCFKRWGCLGILSCLFPCLFCYPVGRGCVTRYEHRKRTKNNARYKIRFMKKRHREQTQS